MVADSGVEAIEKVRWETFDVVLMDVQMPDMDGFSAARLIREIPGCESLPIVALTANAMIGDREKALTMGMNDYVTKPIDPERLLVTLGKWVEPGGRAAAPQIARPDKEDGRGPAGLPVMDLPGIDIQTGLRRASGNNKLYMKILGKFVAGQEHVVEHVESALRDNEMEKAERLAHTLKGVSGIIGAEGLYARAMELEEALRGRDNAAVQAAMVKVAEALKPVLAGINGLMMRDSADGEANHENG